MSTFEYTSGAAAFKAGQINWVTSPFAALLVNIAYSPSQAHDNFVSDIPASAIVARSGPMVNNKITAQGVYQGTVPEFQALRSASEVTGFVIYQNTGHDNTSQLVYFSDQGFGFPFFAVGINYFITYDQISGGWFIPFTNQNTLYLTSQLYPIIVIEHMTDTSHLLDQPQYQYGENLTDTSNFTAGTLGLALITYGNWPAEHMTDTSNFTAGTLTLGLITYGNWPAEHVTDTSNFTAGTLVLSLQTYNNWPAENITEASNFTAGTLT